MTRGLIVSLLAIYGWWLYRSIKEAPTDIELWGKEIN